MLIHHNGSNKDPHASLPHFPHNCNCNMTHLTWYIHPHYATRMSKWSKKNTEHGVRMIVIGFVVRILGCSMGTGFKNMCLLLSLFVKKDCKIRSFFCTFQLHLGWHNPKVQVMVLGQERPIFPLLKFHYFGLLNKDLGLSKIIFHSLILHLCFNPKFISMCKPFWVAYRQFYFPHYCTIVLFSFHLRSLKNVTHCSKTLFKCFFQLVLVKNYLLQNLLAIFQLVGLFFNALV